jgi:hypothetical protein
MTKFGINKSVIQTDHGGKLALSNSFHKMILKDCNYMVEPTGDDSPSQNDGAEIYNNTLVVKVQTLL